MHVSVCICTRDRELRLAAALESLTRLAPPPDEWETIVVDNGSRRPVEAAVRPFVGRLRLRTAVEPETGLSRARNRCLELARGDYVVFIDDDVSVPSGWLRAYCRAFERHPGAAAFGGPILPVLDSRRRRRVFEALQQEMPGVVSLLDPDLPEGPIPCAGDPERQIAPWGANMAFRRDALGDHIFDVRLGRRGPSLVSGEETRLMTELRAAGHTLVWVPGAGLRHHIGPERCTRRYIRRYCRGLGWSIGYDKARAGSESTDELLAHADRTIPKLRRRWWTLPPWAPAEAKIRVLRDLAILEGLRRGYAETAAASATMEKE